MAVEEPRDRAEPQPPLQLAEDRGEPERRLLGRAVGLLQPAPGEPDLGVLGQEVDQGPRAPRGGPRVSGLSSQISSGGSSDARAGAIAALLPAANPPFRGRAVSDAQPPQPFSRIAEARRSAESSPEALSTTTTRAPGWPATSGSSDRRQSIASPADR